MTEKELIEFVLNETHTCPFSSFIKKQVRKYGITYLSSLTQTGCAYLEELSKYFEAYKEYDKNSNN